MTDQPRYQAFAENLSAMDISTAHPGLSAMTMHETFSPTDTAASSGALSNWLRLAGQRIVTWVTTCADYYAAAAMYEQLSRLSNAELHKRGLSRDTVARDVFQSSDHLARG
jgi:hypothetical protein